MPISRSSAISISQRVLIEAAKLAPRESPELAVIRPENWNKVIRTALR